MISNPKVAFHTLGCKLNYTETSAIAQLFIEKGYARVEIDEEADIYVINTCSVTEFADKKCRQIVTKIRNRHPSGKIIMIGCYAQLNAEELASIPGVSLVLGTHEKFKLLEYLEKPSLLPYYKQPIKHIQTFDPAYSEGDRTRTFFKIQDGCDYFCSFCTIPLARGRSRSASIADTLKKLEEIEKKGTREVVLTGVNIGDFGREHNETFFDLLKAIAHYSSIPRFRISSIEPNLLSFEMIDFIASHPQFVPHFHIPLQSGSDTLLKVMRRKYDTAHYRSKIEYIQQKIQDACIGADVIVGFPGESDEEFKKTVDFLSSLRVSYLHVFTYSERRNTTAIKMKETVPMPVRKERSIYLQQLSRQWKKQFYQRSAGKSKTVLFEKENHEGYMYGYTENYIKVQAPYDESYTNQLIPVILDNLVDDQDLHYTAHIHLSQ